MVFILILILVGLYLEIIFFNMIKFMKKDSWYFENNFYYKANKKRILKIIDHYEVYKKIFNIKGQIVECGVFKGASLIRLLTFRDLYENSKKRKVYGFDAFGKFPRPKNKKILTKKTDTKFAKNHDTKNGIGISLQKLEDYINKKNITNFQLIKGDVNETVPDFINKNKKIKIALLHLDLDIYEPTFNVLSYLYKNVVRNGIILLDDYNHIKGATRAINDFFKNKKIKINKASKFGRPYYIVKK